MITIKSASSEPRPRHNEVIVFNYVLDNSTLVLVENVPIKKGKSKRDAVAGFKIKNWKF